MDALDTDFDGYPAYLLGISRISHIRGGRIPDIRLFYSALHSLLIHFWSSNNQMHFSVFHYLENKKDVR